MNHLNSFSLSIGAMSDTKIVISCIDYNHEILAVADFQEQVIEQLVDYYHQRLLQNKATTRLLFEFGITTADIKKLKLGLCDRALKQVIPACKIEEGASIRGTLEVHGLLQASGHEVFRGCVVMPLYDENGFVAGIFGRRMAQYIRRNGRRHVLWLATQDAINKLSFPAKIKELHYEH